MWLSRSFNGKGYVMRRKRGIAIICVIALGLFVFLVGSSRTYHGTNELIKKARKEIPIADADKIEIQYAGMSVKDDMALVWFVSGNEYQAHYYLPIGFNIVGDDEYTFFHTYKPLDRGQDIAVLQWCNGYSFIINNPKCVAVRITDNSGIHEEHIKKDSYPYVFYNKLLPSEYVFLDKDGNEVF